MRFSKAHPQSEPKQILLPLFSMPVSAGTPNAADDYVEERLDLTQLLVKRPESTFYVKVEGESMIDASVQSGDLLVVDRSVEARHKDIVIAIVEGEFTVKVLHRKPALRLVSPNKNQLTEIDEPFEIWGVVLWVVHKAR
jgi:DNA polymerase V